MNHTLKRSFKRAFIGFSVGWKEPNFRRHLASMAIVILCMIYYQPSLTHIAIILMCIFSVLCAELFNTAIERLAEGHKNPRAALDVSASAVLVISIGSAIVGLIIFTNYAWSSPGVLLVSIIITPTLWVIMEKYGPSK